MNCVATIATHDKSNQITNNSNRIACSHNDGDCPRGDLLRLTATSFGTFSFEATAATVSACASEPFGEGDMVDRSNQSLMQHEAASLPMCLNVGCDRNFAISCSHTQKGSAKQKFGTMVVVRIEVTKNGPQFGTSVLLHSRESEFPFLHRSQ